MKIQGMRWGYDGVEPVEGHLIVELRVADDMGRNYFVTASAISEYETFAVSELPQFDIMMTLPTFTVDFEYEYKKLEDMIFEKYETDLKVNSYEDVSLLMPEQMKYSRFANTFDFLHNVLRQLDKKEAKKIGTAEKFIEFQVGREI